MWADIFETRRAKIQHSGHKGSSHPAIEWALLRLNHCSLFLVREDIVALKLSR